MKKRFLVAPLLLAVVLAVHSPQAAADCNIDQPTEDNVYNAASPPAGCGQSFTACETGFVKSISFSVGVVPSGPISLGLQAGTYLSPQSNPQGVTVVSGLNTVVLDTPFPVTNGVLYSFGLLPTAGTLTLSVYGPMNPYAEGKFIYFTGLGYALDPNYDLMFSVEIVTDYPVATLPATWGHLKSLYR